MTRFVKVLCWFIVLAALPASVSRIRAADPDPPPPRKILFDTDPGGDDMFALLWLQSLSRQGHAELVAVTTTAGNVDSRQTFLNASRALALGGHPEVELARAASRQEETVDASHIHGRDGIGNLSRSLPPAPHRWDEAPRADDLIIEKLSSASGPITLVAVGPLTNLAAAERKAPGILARAKEIVWMGGAFRHRGNITPRAEFNTFCDPEAAQYVFANCEQVVVLPLDVTTQVNFGARQAEAVLREAGGSATAAFLDDLSTFLISTTQGFRENAGKSGFHVHDAVALAYLYHPEMLFFRRAQVQIETSGQWTRGQTIFDERHGAKRRANAWVAQQVDAESLLHVLVEDFKLLCETP